MLSRYIFIFEYTNSYKRSYWGSIRCLILQKFTGKKTLILCDRGAMDGSAYCDAQTWQVYSFSWIIYMNIYWWTWFIVGFVVYYYPFFCFHPVIHVSLIVHHISSFLFLFISAFCPKMDGIKSAFATIVVCLLKRCSAFFWQMVLYRSLLVSSKYLIEIVSSVSLSSVHVIVLCCGCPMLCKMVGLFRFFSKLAFFQYFPFIIFSRPDDCVIHLQTAASGAAEFYSCANNVARKETAEQVYILVWCCVILFSLTSYFAFVFYELTGHMAW